jgi:hypothetical protein
MKERNAGMKRFHRLGRLCALAVLLAALGLPYSAQAATGTQPYVDFHKQSTAADFAGSALSGIEVASGAAGANIHLAGTGLSVGSNKKLYGVKTYWYGTLESPVFAAAHLFDTAIASWNAQTPVGTWLQVELRAFRPADSHWTKYYNMGFWASGTETIERQSVNGQGDADGFVATDTLLLNGSAAYTKYQYRLTLFTTTLGTTPSVQLISVMTSDSEKEAAGLIVVPDTQVWGKDLVVPKRSQMIYKRGGEVWCSPTSTSMVLAYWGTDVPVPQAADATFDYVYDGNGNWPFNTAWASTYGLEAYITRMGSMAQIEQWIKADVPVIISYAFGVGELPGTPIASSAGHLMVVRGFDASGNVIVNDPAAAADDLVRIVYDRAKLEELWLRNSGGTVYLIYPKGHAIPGETANGSWQGPPTL